MDTQETLILLAISLGLGLLVGMQRERRGSELAGIRTFTLIALLGTLSALVAKTAGIWVIPSVGLGLACILAVGVYNQGRVEPGKNLGLTTEVAALVMFSLGAYLVGGDRTVAVVTAGSVALLLHWKDPMHNFVRRMSDKDVRAIMRFVLITVVILPILPNEKYGPYQVLNPFEIWLVVVLVVSVSLGGYVLYKLVPPSTGTLLGGAIGGLISSTATTVSYARRTRENPESAPLAAQAIMIATLLSTMRVMILFSIFASSFALQTLPPFLATCFVMGAVTFWMWLWDRGAKTVQPEPGNPAELFSTIVFGLLYAVIKLATAWGKDYFGQAGLYGIGVISGLTDLDAITLSVAGMTGNATILPQLAWRIVLVATMSNLAFKFGCVMVLGTPRLVRLVGLLFGISAVGIIAIMLFWPKF